MENKRGKFIVVDGIDGSGKGTIIKMMVAYIFFKDKTNHVFFTREPYISEFNGQIRKMLKENADPYLNAEIFADLLVKDRLVHADWIEAEIMRGHHVVSDRYKYSTLAYQQTQGLAFEKLVEMHKGILVPDLVIIPDVPVGEAIRRLTADNLRDFKEVFERDCGFMEKLRQNYLKLPQQFPEENIKIFTGSSSTEIFEKAKIEIDKIL